MAVTVITTTKDIEHNCRVNCPVLYILDVSVSVTDNGKYNVTVDGNDEGDYEEYRDMFDHLIKKYNVANNDTFTKWFKQLYGDAFSAHVDDAYGAISCSIMDTMTITRSVRSMLFSMHGSYNDLAFKVIGALGEPYLE